VIVELQQNQQRYTNKEGEFVLSAQSEALGLGKIPPLKISPIGDKVELEPGLDVNINGLIIYIENFDKYIASQELIKDLEDSILTNPHYTYREHSKVLGAVMGKTIPIIKISTNNMLKEIEKQHDKIKFAGVKGIVWSLNDVDKLGSSGLISQINWTLSPKFPKPMDKFTTYDLNLSADYSIESLPIIPLDENKRIPDGVLASNLKIINDRLGLLRDDFNAIKQLFYFGVQPSNVTTNHTILATADEADDISIQVVTKKSTIVANQSLPQNQQADLQAELVGEVVNKVDETESTLSQKIDQTENTIKTAQAGDAQAQSELRRQVQLAQQNLANTNATLLQRLKAKGIDI